MSANDELACTYAALILADDNVEITVDKINALLKAAKVHVKPFWPSLFVRVLAHRSVEDLILASGGGGAAPAAAPAAAAAAAAPAAAAPEKKAEEKKPEKAPEPAEESDDDMGFGLFD
eukprot:TRINITY_DN2026_c0_g1_i1.p1 TRINITY_DN2026_c0_g1~~TRINITY_DN2026_c0_g1_i1.p1  ORF type:complete len:118 (-),score=54.78 TRINITY_DN2026_c0_g1_i1:112-465(-)